MMTDGGKETGKAGNIPDIRMIYPSLPSMLGRFDKYARQDCFAGTTREELVLWQQRMRRLLSGLLGIPKMETCPLNAVVEDVVLLPGNIRREHIRIQVEPEVWMPLYLLVPAGADASTRPFICPPGHNGAGKYTVAGLSRYQAVEERIRHYHYDYGMQLAKLGYVAVCPDCRGFGERREDLADAQSLETALGGDCYRLAHMGIPLGIPVAGMLVWDLMRLVDYLEERQKTEALTPSGLGEHTAGPGGPVPEAVAGPETYPARSGGPAWDSRKVSCLGFSGGGMQTLFLAALDERISLGVISGYLYGYRDALLTMNRNCSCNYVPHLWEHLDMGDIASLIAPRPLLVQSCREDRLNGPRGVANAVEQVEIIRKAYELMETPGRLVHEICQGTHRWHGEHLEIHLGQLLSSCD